MSRRNRQDHSRDRDRTSDAERAAAAPQAPAEDPAAVLFSPAVRAVQERLGSRALQARREARGVWSDRATPELAAFLAERDSFYLGTASADGRPYIQHRGGPKGFLKVLDERRLGFADFGGNRQYITLGNLSENDRAFIFLMDYAGRQRIKLWGRAQVVEDDPALLEALSLPGYPGRVERAIIFTLEAWDANCPQHIVRRFDEASVATLVAGLEARIAELETELATLRAG